MLAAFEQLVRLLLNLPYQPVVVDLEIYESYVDEPTAQKGIFACHEAVLKHYQIPTLNYDMSAAPEFLLKLRHPSWYVFQY